MLGGLADETGRACTPLWLGWLLVGAQWRSVRPGGRRLRDAKWLHPTAGRLYGDRAAGVPPPGVAKRCFEDLFSTYSQ